MDSHLLRPYKIQKADDATYYFETSYGLKYKAYFIEYPADTYELYSFSFEKEESRAFYDPRIKDTIITVLENFFESKNSILGYTCDVTDGREMARKRLFDLWFKQVQNKCLRKIDFQADNIYVSLIVKNNDSTICSTIQDIDQLIQEIVSQK